MGRTTNSDPELRVLATPLRREGQVIGGSITLDGVPATVVGVLPPSFDFGGTFSPGRPADLFLPFPLES